MEYWKFKAIDRLKDYNYKKAGIDNIRAEIRQLEDEARTIKSPNIDGGSASTNVTAEDRLLSNIVKRDELKRNYGRAVADCRIVERGLAALKDEDREALRIMYVDGSGKGKGRIEKLMTMWGYTDERSTYRKVDRILIKFTMAVYGITES